MLKSHLFLIIPVVSGFITQFTKFFIISLSQKKLNWRNLFIPGNMPSAHTAFVVSLTTVVAYCCGTTSIEFAITTCFAYIVVYDAMHIRIHIGNNGKAINQLNQQLKLNTRHNAPLNERVGHLPQEVLVGAFIGFLTASLLYMWCI